MRKLWRWIKGFLPVIILCTGMPTAIVGGITYHKLGDWNYWWVWVTFGVTFVLSFYYFTFVAWKNKPDEN